MVNSFTTKKSFSYVDFLYKKVYLGTFSRFFIYEIRLDIKEAFDLGNIIIGTEDMSTIIANINNLNYNFSIKNTKKPINDLFIFFNGVPNKGLGTITIYNITSDFFLEKELSYLDFLSPQIVLGNIPQKNKIPEIIINVLNAFDIGSIRINNGINTILEENKVDLTKENTYIIEYHNNYDYKSPFITLFNGSPTKGSLKIIIPFFPIKQG